MAQEEMSNISIRFCIANGLFKKFFIRLGRYYFQYNFFWITRKFLQLSCKYIKYLTPNYLFDNQISSKSLRYVFDRSADL